MNSRRAWGLATGFLVVALVLTAAVPRLRRDRAVRAARELGLPLSYAAMRRPVPLAQNAAPAIDQAQAARSAPDARDGVSFQVIAAKDALIAGRAKPGQRAFVQRWVERTEGAFPLWRAATARQRVDYGERAFGRDSTWSYEMLQERYAGQTLVAAALLGREPRANLLAAARLAGLMRQENGFTPQLKSAMLAEDCLRVAPRLGMVPEVLAALGPAPDVRDALRPGLANLLRTLDLADKERKSQSLLDALRRVGLFAGDPRTRAMEGWVALWRELPSDPRDLEGAAKVVERRLPALYDLTDTGREGIPLLSRTTAREVVAGLRLMGRSAARRAAMER